MAASFTARDYSRPVKELFDHPPQTGAIHSVFSQAANIVLGDVILSLLSDDLPRVPNGVRLRSDTMVELLRTLEPGMEVQVGGGKLDINARNISIRLPKIPPWEPRPDVAGRRWRREPVAWHVHLLAQHLVSQPDQGGLGILAGPLLLGASAPDTALARMALPALRALAQAAWERDVVGAQAATQRLAGLGPGLTPAGDDALGGFAAVMALLGATLGGDAMPRNDIAATIAATARPRTTALSTTLLVHAARGEVAEHLGETLLALALPVEAHAVVVRAANDLLRFGATSGGDTLLGVLWGLRALLEQGKAA